MMTSTNPSLAYRELWNELLEHLVKPSLKEDLYRSDPTRGLTPGLRNLCHDKNLYPFIYDRIIGALETYCEETLLPGLLHLKGITLIEKAHYCCIKDLNLKATKIWYPVSPLESIYLEKNRLQRQFPSLPARSGAVFRKTIYHKIAGSLRKAAYECISDDFTLKNKGVLNSYIEIIHFVRNGEKMFADKEWHLFAYYMLQQDSHESFLSLRKPLEEFLKCSENMLTSSTAIFQLSNGEYKGSIEGFLSEIRDERLFGNDAEEFKGILRDGDGKLLKQLLAASKNDEEFQKHVANEASRVFAEMVHGRKQIRTVDSYSPGKIVKRLLLIWFRLQKILKEEDKNEHIIHDSLILPFLTEVEKAFPDSEATMKALAEYSKTLLSRIHQGKTELQPDGIREIKCLLSLTWKIPSAKGFHGFFRILLNKSLLEGTSVSINVTQLPEPTSPVDKREVISDISAMLDDATTWALYEREMKRAIPPTFKSFENHGNEIQLEPKVIRSSRWNLEPDIRLNLPRKIKFLSQKILEHLHENSPMRRASIHSSAGTMIITTNIWTFRGKHLTIKVSAAQNCLLTLFEENEELTLRKVSKMVLSNTANPLGFKAIVSIVKSMMTEHSIISKLPPCSEFRDTDVIFLNKQFQPTAEFIKIPNPDYSDNNKPSLKVAGTTGVLKLHKLVLEAAVMNVLKQEREMELSLLEEMVSSKIGPTEASFKDAIERLERDEYLTVDKTTARYLD